MSCSSEHTIGCDSFVINSPTPILRRGLHAADVVEVDLRCSARNLHVSIVQVAVLQACFLCFQKGHHLSSHIGTYSHMTIHPLHHIVVNGSHCMLARKNMFWECMVWLFQSFGFINLCLPNKSNKFLRLLRVRSHGQITASLSFLCKYSCNQIWTPERKYALPLNLIKIIDPE